MCSDVTIDQKYPLKLTSDPAKWVLEVGVDDFLDDDRHTSMEHGVEQLHHDNEARAEDDQRHKQKDDASLNV